MNPLCCIAPVSIDRDRANPVVTKSTAHCQLGHETAAVKTVKSSLSAQVSSVGADFDKSSTASVVVESVTESRYNGNGGGLGASVAGILYKWVNYGKGWRSRWFVLEDGVLSYYKIHGPDKILMSPARDNSVRVIGEDSVRFMRKANWSSHRLGFAARHCKPFGEIHLKVCSLNCIYFNFFADLCVVVDAIRK